MGMTDQLLDLSSKEDTVLDWLGDAEETIRQVLRVGLKMKDRGAVSADARGRAV
jgi:hypothetical protein